MKASNSLLAIFATFFLITLLISCGTKTDKPTTYVDPAFGEFITSYTAGVVSSNSTIKIVFAKAALPSDASLGETSASYFDISPSVEGKTVWLDNQTIEFRPSQRMKAGQIYEVAFQLSKLFSVKKELAEFTYSFQVIPQNYELAVNNIKPYIKTELKRQKIEGSLTTADFAEPELVEKMMSAQQEGKSLKISWEHDVERKNHSFIVEDVVRKEKESEVVLSANGNSIELDKSLEEKVTVPSLDDFKLMNARVIQNPNQYVALQFSDPIKEGQQLNGLISIGDDRGLQLDFDIHDNEIWVYPPVRQAGTKTIYLEAGIRNILDFKMKKPSTAEIVFEQIKPAVKFVGKGSILPSTDGLVVPFEAVNLKAVDVSINKIFENNILQFLQVNTIEGGRELHRVGRNVLKKTIQLDNSGITDLGKWNRFTLDLNKLIATEPGAIYQIGIKFKKSYSAYICEGQSETELTIAEQEEPEENFGYREYYYDDYYYDEGYDWEQRDNPCHTSYYSSSERRIQKNILASDIGLIVKKGDDGTTTVVSTDLKTAKPLAGVTIEMYDFQQQLTNTLTTNADGLATLNSKNFPFAVIAKNGTQRGYLRLVDGESVSLSGFDVSGESISKGLKGFLYGERGVWRPGDSLFLSFILEDKNKTLPPTHPVVFELQNPQGVVTSRLVKSSSENGFYKFATATTPDAPTGNWNARLKVGGAEFSQQIKIETIKPNRLKINLDFGVDKITNNEAHGELSVKWLHGAVARNLKAEFEMIVFKGSTTFKSYESFTFEEINSSFNTLIKPIFQGNLSEEGKAAINVSLESAKYPGFMNVVFKGKVFEESGNFSVDRFGLPFYPYKSYVGVRLPEGEKYSGMLYTDEDQIADVVFLDTDGKPVAREGAEINLYRLDRYWWWDNSSDNIANYIERNASTLVSSGKINASNGKGSWKFKVANADWGTYYIKVCDPVSGHCTSKTFYIDQPGYFGRNSRAEKGGATRLSFSADKQSYNVGEKINLSIPGSGESRAFISIENGSKVLSTQWVETKKGDNKVAIEVTPEMAPNVFVNITLLQPHSQTSNDLPIRLYGIIPLGIENPLTHLDPQIQMPNELEPGQEVRIKVSEKSNRKMTFTLAMVDEGLLDITKFKTPEPWKRFYVREALGVKTWDLFDDVIGAYGGRIERLFAIGGDGELKGKDDDPRANRFKPAVKFFGPYTVNGGNQEVKFTMPQYLGSVKVMVVAGFEGAYGNVDKVVPVRKPLMVLATLPRVLGPEEKVKLPITLFTQDKKIRSAKVEIKLTGPLAMAGEASRTIQIPSSGDITVDFDLAVKAEVGVAKVMVKATSGSYQSTDEIEIEVRNPNVTETQITESFLEVGKVWNSSVAPAGMLGTNSSVLEVSTIPPINLGYRLRYLMDYPHGCVEQTTSAAFPQLYLDVVKELTEQEKTRTKFNVTRAVERLKMFLARDGGFGYWPGDNESNQWGTTYAGHFLLEASSKGYFVPDDMLKRWKKYQKNKAAEWRKITNKNYYYDNELIQSYRLYTLALAGTPELGAMNRLREEPSLSIQSKWMLAASYMKAGQPEAAKSLVTNLTTSIKPYQELSYTFGSDVRDQAIILETLILMKEKTKAFELVKILSSRLSNQQWMSTQTVAYALKSIGQFVASEKRGELKFSYNLSGKEVNAVSQLPLSQVALDLKGIQKLPIKVTNEGGGSLFVRIINTGIPALGQEKAAENNLAVYTSFQDMKGNDIDVSKLVQGTEFKATVTVNNPGLRGDYENIALTQIFPSGWEINNLRLTNDEGQAKTDRGDYQDIRDDRVYTYFRLTGSRTFTVLLTASYAGKFYLPGVSCSAMYDNSISSKQTGKFIEVVKKEIVVN
jgi:uncharacterized protein YfaS (alpha-2-macroglobulin family)